MDHPEFYNYGIIHVFFLFAKFSKALVKDIAFTTSGEDYVLYYHEGSVLH